MSIPIIIAPSGAGKSSLCERDPLLFADGDRLSFAQVDASAFKLNPPWWNDDGAPRYAERRYEFVSAVQERFLVESSFCSVPVLWAYVLGGSFDGHILRRCSFVALPPAQVLYDRALRRAKGAGPDRASPYKTVLDAQAVVDQYKAIARKARAIAFEVDDVDDLRGLALAERFGPVRRPAGRP